MTEFWKHHEGQLIDGAFPLTQHLDSGENSAVFLTTYSLPEPQKAVIKLIRADPKTSELQVRLWKEVTTLSHPNLMRIFQAGQCELSNLPLLYVVMEYADEDLSKVIPIRRLTPTEAKELLEPSLSAIGYVHAKGFVHGHLKPANFMAVDGQLRISSDGLCRIEECGPSKPSAYDPPEFMASGPTTAGDVWSLGTTLVQALTQRLPVWTASEPRDPILRENLPAPYAGIARHCLKWNPQSRWTIAAIRRELTGAGVAAPEQLPPAEAERRSSLKWIWVSTAVLSVVLIAMIIASKLRNRGGEVYQPPAVVAQQQKPSAFSEKKAADKADKAAADRVAAQKAAAEKAATDRAAAQKTAAEKAVADRAAAEKAAAQKAATERAARSVPAPPSQPETGSVAGGIVQQVIPQPLAQAKNSIRGKVAVVVKVRADASGNVADAEFENPGPSKYFADLAMGAARRWKLAPSSAWNLRFEFRRSGTTVTPTRAR